MKTLKGLGEDSFGCPLKVVKGNRFRQIVAGMPVLAKQITQWFAGRWIISVSSWEDIMGEGVVVGLTQNGGLKFYLL